MDLTLDSLCNIKWRHKRESQCFPSVLVYVFVFAYLIDGYFPFLSKNEVANSTEDTASKGEQTPKKEVSMTDKSRLSY